MEFRPHSLIIHLDLFVPPRILEPRDLDRGSSDIVPSGMFPVAFCGRDCKFRFLIDFGGWDEVEKLLTPAGRLSCTIELQKKGRANPGF